MKRKKRPARLKRRLIKSYLTSTISITLVLFLVGMMSLLILNAGRLSDYVREHVGFTLVLNDDVREVEILRLQKILSATDYVKDSKYVNKEEAAEQLTKELGEDFVGFLGFNPLFSSLDIKLHAEYMQQDSLAILENNFLAYPQVNEVYYQRDLVRIINENVKRISLFLMVFSVLLLFIFSTLINNTIRIAIYSQRFIIHTMKLVGATRSFIRRPFIVKNIGYGILGALLANLSILGLIYSYRQDFEGVLDPQQVGTIGLVFGIVLVFGILISWLSTYFSVNKYLRIRYDELFYT
ncbi:cell division protein FtsX [Sunxiuqinia dokdonensis]|uniref:Cell division protein FtsX n=1 Tax=Sunxiuqinia dokdonensis TaxID=1409788 RepID=A0A0L8V6Z5_9BACT|nr:ABC transporter permease [Sunxiuqinia dokdonensis]KOH43982.1 cell division protein FtsX [Sunxiuqinia dokdonensis]